jgi:ankyrin repeat protein
LFSFSPTEEELNAKLFKAIDEENLGEVKRLLTSDSKNNFICADINASRPDHDEQASPLIVATSKGFSEIVDYLLKHDPAPNLNYQCKIKKITALHAAAGNGHLGIVTKLVNAGSSLELRDAAEITPLMSSIIGGQHEVAKFLLSVGSNPLSVTPKQKETPLFIAAMYGRSNILSTLLEGRAKESIETPNTDGLTPLVITAKNGHLDALTVLLSNGANPNYVTPTKDTPLHWAAWKNHEKLTIKLLQYGAKADILNDKNYTAKGVSRSNTSVVLDDYPRHNQQLLQEASEKSDNSSIIYALFNKGAYYNTQNKLGETPLMLACKAGNLKNVKLFIKEGAKVTPDSTILLFNALESGNVELIKYLLSLNINHTNKDGDSISYVSIKLNKSNILEYLLEEAGMTINDINEHKIPVVLYAAQWANPETMAIILKHTSTQHVQDKQSNTILHYAARNLQYNLVALLSDLNANCLLNINDINSDGFTPLMIAASLGNSPTVKTLLDFNADIDICENVNGKNALLIARDAKHNETIKILVLHHLRLSNTISMPTLNFILTEAGFTKKDICADILASAEEAGKVNVLEQARILEECIYYSASAFSQYMYAHTHSPETDPIHLIFIKLLEIRQTNAYIDASRREEFKNHTHLIAACAPPPPPYQENPCTHKIDACTQTPMTFMNQEVSLRERLKYTDKMQHRALVSTFLRCK